jgi:hypothetical protein
METVYIVGAGASVDADFPTGKELKEIISEDLAYKTNMHGLKCQGQGSELIYNTLTANYQHNLIISKLKKAQEISSGIMGAASIDNYIDIHRDDPEIAEVGKLAIAKIISEKEENSPLFFEQNRDYELLKFADMWFLELLISLTTGCPFEQLEGRFEKITFIVFNYDRCIEHFLGRSLAVLYRKSIEEVSVLMKKLTIIHPYGSLGADHGFGFKAYSATLRSMAGNIKTFTESIDSSETLNLKSKMATAKRLVFLGFAFHPINMKLLTPIKSAPKINGSVNVYATTLGLSKSDVNISKRVLEHMYKPLLGDITFNSIDGKCTDLFSEFSLSIGYK